MSLSYVKNETDAEDVAQETFIKAFYNLAGFRGESKFSTWLISIALNEARSRLRRQAAIRIVSLDELQGEEIAVCPAPLHVGGRFLPTKSSERKSGIYSSRPSTGSRTFTGTYFSYAMLKSSI